MMQEELNYIIDSLPEEQRRVIREHYFERRTMKQISERMGYTKSRLTVLKRKPCESSEHHGRVGGIKNITTST